MNSRVFRPSLREGFTHLVCAGLLVLPAAAASTALSLPEAIRVLQQIGPEGKGNAAATEAWKVLASRPAEELPRLLEAMNGANDYAVNWISTAVDVVAASGKPPVAALGQFLGDTSHHPRARYRAWELIATVHPEAASQLLTGMLTDPGPELRRDAVAQRMNQAAGHREAGEGDPAALLYRQALAAARDAQQIDEISTALLELGQPVDLPQVFGFLQDWRVIGPFDNTGLAGFAQPFPPERELRFDLEYPGKSGNVRWVAHTSTNEHGLIDLNRVLGKTKEVTGYAATEFHADREQPAELRLGCKNAWKIWFNGQFVFGRDEYHMGAEIDQYRLPVTLRRGINTILVKLCQNELQEDWTEEWEFQLRITDALGTPVRTAPRHTQPRN